MLKTPGSFQAVVLAVEPVTHATVCGLTLAERGSRVAGRAGAAHVVVVDSASSAADLPQLAKRDLDLLILRVRDQVVHFSLVNAVRPEHSEASGTQAPSSDITVAVDPTSGDYAGAIWVPAARAAEVLDALSIDPLAGDSALIDTWLAEGEAIAKKPHGEIARHPAATREDRASATKMLFRLVHKQQDSLLAKYVNRRVSYPFTRLLLPTRITPNMLSILVFMVGVTGCYFVAQGTYWGAVVGCGLMLFAGYLDGCDGEIARLRHEGSKFGAWLDTIVDEITTVLFMICVGLHMYQLHPLQWIAISIVIGVASALISVYVIYYYLIVIAKSGNSQDYPTSSGGPLDYLRMLIKRDFINLAALVMAAFGQMQLVYAGIFVGAPVTASILVLQHIALRRSRRNPAVAEDTESELAASSSGTFTEL